MITPATDSTEPDPTTQMAWPAARNRTQQLESNTPDINGLAELPPAGTPTANSGQRPQTSVGKQRLSTWGLITLTISMAGAQIAWTVELGYGTPFLLGLGLSAQLTSLVWLAGPISGLVAQPLIGALSDASTSKYRRRFWIIASTCALVASTLVLAFCEDIAAFFVDLSRADGDRSEKREAQAKAASIALAIFSFYVLDFALNGLQASLRNLLLDVAPPSQLSTGNAWHSRMTNAGNIVGYGFGFLPLAQLPVIRLIGGDQFRKFCIICIVILTVTIVITCYCHEEEARPGASTQHGTVRDVFEKIHHAAVNLPKPIRRVCYVQLFAFMAWFPFLFYSTAYVGQIMAYEQDREPDPDLAIRMGELAMLIYSVVGVLAGTILPHLAVRDRRLMAHKSDVDEDAEVSRLRAMVRQWRVEAARKGLPLHLPVMPFLLRNIWTGALLFFAFLTFTTFFISTVAEATIFIGFVGICWAVAVWVPFAIIMELLKEPPPPTPSARDPRRNHFRQLSAPVRQSFTAERRPLIRRRSFDEYDVIPEDDINSTKPLAGGTVLGIHNLAIVAPQLIVAVVTSMIFRLADGATSGRKLTGGEDTYHGKNGVAWVLRFGGLCALVAAALARKVPPTPTEKAMRRRLGEMKLLGDEGDP